eukprot:GCRY01000746.1.p1 GENE.GCRY01000746.1~~GCRY01000746.1.p1  ORF type:complete len:212 (+),score=40.64 GCRY01000746.1:115-750(+)
MFSKCNTVKPQKKHKEGSKQHDLHKHAKATLGSGDLKAAVMLPPGEDMNEWLACNTVDFFNQISALYGTLAEFCTDDCCPIMSAGNKYEYLWADGEKVKKPIKCSAPQYVDYLLSWVSDMLDDETLFPTTIETPFPKKFTSVVKNIFKRLFRVYAHIYYSHFEKIVSLGEEAHLNTCFKHFYYFTQEFGLVARKDMEPLEELIQNLIEKKK